MEHDAKPIPPGALVLNARANLMAQKFVLTVEALGEVRPWSLSRQLGGGIGISTADRYMRLWSGRPPRSGPGRPPRGEVVC